MAISFECTGCDKKLKVKDEFGGKRIKCPECQAVLNVPKPEPVADEDDFLGGLNEAVKQEKKRPRAVIEDDDDAEDYEDDPRPSKTNRRTKTTPKKRSSSSSSGSAGGVLKAIGGVLVTIVVILGIIGKVAKVARVGGAFNQAITWQHFRHPAGGGSIDMPGAATLNLQASRDPNAQVHSCSAGNFACSIATAALPPMAIVNLTTNPAAFETVFTEMKRELIAKPGARLISETRIQHSGGAKGIEIRFEINGLVNLSRSFLTSSHIVAAEFVFKTGSEPATERDRFFNSLQLTGGPIGMGAAMPGPGATPPGMPGG